MKTRFKRFGKSSLSLMLSLVMIVSTVLVGSLVSADADSSNEISAADVVEDVAATVDSDLVDSNSLDSVEDTAVANDNLADVSKSISLTDDKSVETLQTTETKLEVSTVSDKKTEKSVPESSGDADPSVASGCTRVYFYNNQCWSTVNAYIWKDGEDGSAPVAYPGNDDLLKESVQYADTYFIDIDTSKYDRIIFNNGNNRNKTGDINISDVDSTKAYCYYIQGETSNNTIALSKISDNTDPYVIYFKIYNGWSKFASDLRAHFAGSGHETTWTGRSMSWLQDDLYYVVVRNNDYDLSNASNHSNGMTVVFNVRANSDSNSDKFQTADISYNRNTYASTVFSCPGNLTNGTYGQRTVNNNKYYLQYGDASHNIPSNFDKNIPVTLDIVNNQLVNYGDFNVSSLSLVKSSNYSFALATASSGESNIVNTDSNITVNKTGSAINAGAESNNNGTVHKYARFSYNSDNVTNVRVYVNNLSGTNYTVSGPDATISSKTAHIYAKTGTIRDDGGDYNKYSKIAEKVEIINSSGESIGSNDKGYTDIYDHHTYYRLKTATVNKGDTIKIRITIKDRYKGLYYVKGFCVNGFSDGIIDSEPTNKNQTVYEFDYIVPNNLDTNYVEITPVYYYFDESTESHTYKYITFSAEDFDDDTIHGMWGNTLACYAWYTGSLGDATSSYQYAPQYDITQNEKDAAMEKDALGGYPGQPMLYMNGAYYMQVPEYVGVNHNHIIEGITLNNYFWDDVHRSINNGEFLGQNNTFKQSSNANSYDKNCQTYDYDDFLALKELDVKKIVFSFKYRTYQSDERNYDSGNLKNKDGAATGYFTGPNIDFHYVDETQTNADGSINTYYTGNGWDVLVDYNDVPIDLFGQRLRNTLTQDRYAGDDSEELVLSSDSYYLNDKYVLNYFDDDISDKDKTKVYVVSNGYEPYYKQDTDTTKYIGKYATKWYVYTKDSNGTFDYVGALPPSAFLTGLNSDKNGYDENNYLTYSDAAKAYKATTDGSNSWDTYKTIYNKCAGRPVVISYESAIFDDGANGVVSNYGYRCDGRWYYSFGDEPIYANILIQYANRDENGNLPTDGYGKTAYTTDKIKLGTVNQGEVTNAKAYFTNVGHEGSIYMDTDYNENDKYRFYTPAGRVTGSNGKTYKFVGWYSNSGSKVYSRVNSGNNILSTSGDKPMDSIITFIARFEEVETTTSNALSVSHTLYSDEKDLTENDPIVHNGTGNTFVQVEVYSSEGTLLYNSYTRPSLADVPSEYLDPETNNKIKITLTTTANDGTSLYDIYYKNTTTDESGKTTHSYSKTGLNTSNDQTSSTTFGISSTNSSLESKKVVYEYNVTDLFTSGESKQVTLDFTSDLAVSRSVTIAFKYYDRLEYSNAAATINTTAKELDFDVNLDGTKTITDAVVEAVKNESGGAMKCIDNILNEYYFWPTQAEAVGSDGIKGQAHYRTDVTGNTSYAEAGLTNVDYKYHTDAYGRLSGESDYNPDPEHPTAALEQWVSYANDTSTVSESTALNDPSTVTSVVVWAYNTPKTYVVDVYAPTEDNQVLTNHTTAKLLDSTEDVYYDLSNSNPQKGFYNQRLGEVDTDESGKKWGSNDAVDYLRTYGIENVFLGDKIETQSSAKVAKTAEEKANDSENGDASDYYELTFSGWYAYTDKRDSDNKIIEGSEELVKVTTNSNYGYRITKDMKLVAGYVKTPVSKVGVSLTDNGIDYYLDQNNKDVELRFNTQLNVYGTSEPDTSITKVSAIYVQLPSTYEVNSETKVFTADDITPELLADIESRIKLNNYSKLEEVGRRVINIRNLKLKEDVNVDGKITRFTYDTQGTNALTLTNKNRVQFVLPMTEAQFNGDGENVGQFSAFLVYGAIYRDGGWILSDNYIPYISNSNSNSNVNGIQPSTASVEEFIFSVEEDVTDEDTVVLYGGLGD